ncbi:hypothetical protein IG631_03469 [Alternaria alternata]|nr:hypothetical protein IG631_03469 [Alternaria alternata]
MPGWMHDGSSVASRLHATTIIRAMAAGCSLLGMGASHLVCAGCPFARMAVAMLAPGRNGCGSSRRNASKAAHPQAATAQRTWARHAASQLRLENSDLLLLGAMRSDRASVARAAMACRISLPFACTL